MAAAASQSIPAKALEGASQAQIGPTFGNAPAYPEASRKAYEAAAREASKEAWPAPKEVDLKGSHLNDPDDYAGNDQRSHLMLGRVSAASQKIADAPLGFEAAPTTPAERVLGLGQSLEALAVDTRRLLHAAAGAAEAPEAPLGKALERFSDLGDANGELARNLAELLVLIDPSRAGRPPGAAGSLAGQAASLARLAAEAKSLVRLWEGDHYSLGTLFSLRRALAEMVLLNLGRLCGLCLDLVGSALGAARSILPEEKPNSKPCPKAGATEAAPVTIDLSDPWEIFFDRLERLSEENPPAEAKLFPPPPPPRPRGGGGSAAPA
jgi:hypothetical protein